MRTWVKGTLAAGALVAGVAFTLAAIGGYYILGNLDRRNATETEGLQAMEAVAARFGTRPPLIEIIDPRRADIRINRPQEDAGRPVATMHVLNWNRETRQLVRTEFPLWLMHFSSGNLLSKLGIAPAKFRLTVRDIERYGPGIVVDYDLPGSFRVLAWVD
jgi:hypothetical protein